MTISCLSKPKMKRLLHLRQTSAKRYKAQKRSSSVLVSVVIRRYLSCCDGIIDPININAYSGEELILIISLY